MKLGIVSDSHGRADTVTKALALLRSLGATAVLHCGDLDDSGVLDPFRGWDAHFVFGNCDRGLEPVLKPAIEAVGGRWYEPFGHLELEGVAVAWLHGDDARLMRELVASEAFDYLFYGHTHVAKVELVGRTHVINPGALQRARAYTVGLLDLTTRDYSQHTVS